jgi:hypothetical protein
MTRIHKSLASGRRDIYLFTVTPDICGFSQWNFSFCHPSGAWSSEVASRFWKICATPYDIYIIHTLLQKAKNHFLCTACHSVLFVPEEREEVAIYVYSKSILSDVFPFFILQWGRDSSVGIATCYRLDGPGLEPLWGEIFSIHPDRPQGPSILLYNG